MANIFVLEIVESLDFTESIRKNIHTLSVNETVNLSQNPVNQFKFENVNEKIILLEKVTKTDTLKLSINETLVFSEQLFPRVYIANIYEGIVLLERLSKDNIIEKLIFNESLIIDKRKIIKDNLTIIENLDYRIHRSLIINQTLQLKEGLSAYKIDVNGNISSFIDPFCNVVPILTFGIVVQETPSGVVNGSNTNFVLSFEPIQDDSLLVFLNGIAEKKGLVFDYVFDGVTIITFNTAPLPGDTILVYYLR